MDEERSHDPVSARREQLALSARRHLNATDAETYLSLIRPTITLQGNPASSNRSQLGGRPILSTSTQWPYWGDDPLSFVARIDLSELQGVNSGLPFPTSGTINFFYDTKKQPWGFRPDDRSGWRVLFTPQDDGTEVHEPPVAPTFNRIPLNLLQGISVPRSDEAELHEMSHRVLDALYEIEDETEQLGWPDAPHHALGGWPLLQQATIWDDCALASAGIYMGDQSFLNDSRTSEILARNEDWVLLLQLDTDDAAGWMWGDAGMLYFAIQRSDLATLNFDKTWMVLQCG